MHDGRPCKHLEKLLPRITNHSVAMFTVADIDDLSLLHYDYTRSVTQEEIDRFCRILHQYGMKDYETVILIERFVYDKTFQQIAKEQGYTSVGSCFFVFQKAVDSLKRQGFSPTSSVR